MALKMAPLHSIFPGYFEGAAGDCPKILLPKRVKMVLCSFHRSHREVCTRNRPLSETKFLDDFWGPFLSQPL